LSSGTGKTRADAPGAFCFKNFSKDGKNTVCPTSFMKKLKTRVVVSGSN